MGLLTSFIAAAMSFAESIVVSAIFCLPSWVLSSTFATCSFVSCSDFVSSSIFERLKKKPKTRSAARMTRSTSIIIVRVFDLFLEDSIFNVRYSWGKTSIVD